MKSGLLKLLSLRLRFVIVLVTAIIIASPLSANSDYCESALSDHDGDGWGWEYQSSCIVTGSSADTLAHSDSETTYCSSAELDPDGDGWGWENGESCRTPPVTTAARVQAVEGNQTPVCARSASDPDGDGWGWESGSSCRVLQSGEITDLILIAGQSNVLGARTSVNISIDRPDSRVFAYTSSGWQVANLYQTWDRGFYPGPGYAHADSSIIYNNFALHFGKRLVELAPDRVVGFVLLSEPGKGISYWNPGAAGMNRIQQKALEALNALPYKSSFDGVLWHQGETDWALHGTRDPEVTVAVADDYYPQKLQDLITNLRNESWHSADAPFICGETIRAPGVNTHLRALNDDSDPLTGCVPGFGLPATFAGGSHFNAESLRQMGTWYAEQYFSMTR